MMEKPAILLITKTDTVDRPKDQFMKIKDDLKYLRDNYSSPDLIDENIKPKTLIEFDDIIPISSVTKHNLGKFKEVARCVIDT